MTVSDSMAARHKPGHCRRRHYAVLLIHAAYYGRRAADRLVAHADRLCRLDVGKAVVVDYLQYLGLLKTGYRLRFFVVVNEHKRAFLRGRSRWYLDNVPTTFSFSSSTG